MQEYRYTILLTPEEGGYTARVPAMPGLATEGDTLEEAIAMAKDAMQVYIASLVADGEPIPEETDHPQALVVRVAVEMPG